MTAKSLFGWPEVIVLSITEHTQPWVAEENSTGCSYTPNTHTICHKIRIKISARQRQDECEIRAQERRTFLTNSDETHSHTHAIVAAVNYLVSRWAALKPPWQSTNTEETTRRWYCLQWLTIITIMRKLLKQHSSVYDIRYSTLLTSFTKMAPFYFCSVTQFQNQVHPTDNSHCRISFSYLFIETFAQSRRASPLSSNYRH